MYMPQWLHNTLGGYHFSSRGPWTYHPIVTELEARFLSRCQRHLSSRGATTIDRHVHFVVYNSATSRGRESRTA